MISETMGATQSVVSGAMGLGMRYIFKLVGVSSFLASSNCFFACTDGILF